MEQTFTAHIEQDVKTGYFIGLIPSVQVHIHKRKALTNFQYG